MARRFSTGVHEGWIGPGKKDGKIQSLTPEEGGLHIDLAKRDNFEWWYFDARLDNGFTVIVFFHARNHLTRKTEIEVTIYNPEGSKKSYHFPFQTQEFKASRKKTDIKLRNNYLSVDYSSADAPVYELFIEEGEISLKLHFTGSVSGWKPGKGFTKFGQKGYFHWIVPLPRARVKAQVRFGSEEFTSEGIGYHDHNWGSGVNLSKIIDYWQWGRIYTKTFTVIFAIIQLNKKMKNHKIAVFMLAEKNKPKISTGEFIISTKEIALNARIHSYYPKRFQLEIPSQVKVQLEVQKIIDVQDLL
ncbi:MAG: hypothetical protein K9W42_05380 [Candidatus Heimdallarchaeota archaeon]|nr:hypothetical protein [Candidatus Heimdallarchaeota archaeon]